MAPTAGSDRAVNAATHPHRGLRRDAAPNRSIRYPSQFDGGPVLSARSGRGAKSDKRTRRRSAKGRAATSASGRTADPSVRPPRHRRLWRRAGHPAAIRADLHRLPVPRPFAAPWERAAADDAGLLRQIALVGGDAQIDVFASHAELKASLYVHVKL